MPSELPSFDAEAAPADPLELFAQWLEEAKDAGQLLPHGATLSTADDDGTVSARVLVLRDIDDGFASTVGIATLPVTLFVAADGTIVRQTGVLEEDQLRRYAQELLG